MSKSHNRFKDCTLAEVTIFKNGKGLKNSLYIDSGQFPVFGANGRIANTNELLNNSPVIVIGRVGAYCGSLYRLKVSSWTTDNTIVAIPKQGIDFDYLYYKLISLDIRRTAIGSAQPLLTQEGLKRLKISIPPLLEQKAIAHILGTLDDKIELNRKMNETLEAMARVIFKSWFVDFDPVKAKAEGREPSGMDADTAALFPDSFEDSPLGLIPKGWKAGKLSEIAKNVRKGIKPESSGNDTPYIALEHMPRKSISLFEWETTENIVSNKFKFYKGDILFGKLRRYFHKVGIAPLNGVCSTDILVINSIEEKFYSLTVNTLSSTEFIAYTNAGSTGTKMPRTNWDIMSQYDIVIPSTDIVRLFNKITAPSYELIISNVHQSKTLSKIRNTLLPKLISGEIRIKDAENVINDASNL